MNDTGKPHDKTHEPVDPRETTLGLVGQDVVYRRWKTWPPPEPVPLVVALGAPTLMTLPSELRATLFPRSAPVLLLEETFIVNCFDSVQDVLPV